MKIKCNMSLKRSGHVESKIQDLEEFDRLYIPAKSKVKSKKYHNIKCDI